MSEKDLAKVVVKWLQNQYWDVYQEVAFWGGGSPVADIAAVKNGMLWIIECKTTLNLAVLEQATKWTAHFRSIAIPDSNSKGREIAYRVAHDYLNVGVIRVGKLQKISYLEFQEVNQSRFPPPLMREYNKLAKGLIARLRPEHKTYCEAGTKGGGYYTPYRETMNEVRKYIRYNPGCSMKEIMAGLSHHHYANDKSAVSGVKNALENYESSWCVIKIIDGKNHYFEGENAKA